jgi:signal transduction histidine kinase
MRAVSRTDAAVAVGFALVAVAEAVVRYRAVPGLLIFDASGAAWLLSLAVRRTRPVVTISALAVGGVVGSVVTLVVWPDAAGGAGVWILAMVLAAYSIGAHGADRVVGLGVLVPLLVVVAADATTRSGWDRVSGMLFVTVFVGALPTGVGRLVRARRARLRMLRDQQARIVAAQRDQQEAAVLAERLRTVQRLGPELLEGLRHVAMSAEAGADPALVEEAARALLGRTRQEVTALTAPVQVLPTPEVPRPDHLAALRGAAQPWAVMAAGVLVAGLFLESRQTLDPTAPWWLLLPAALLAAGPVALVWWRPVWAVVLAWVATAAFSRLVVPLDGSLSESGFAIVVSFAVAALSRRSIAFLGLILCWAGQVVGVGTDDPLGEGLMLLAAWLGGSAINEVSRLVEQTRANTEVLATQEGVAATRAVVEERLRLARELHDAIGHTLTVVALQAGAARRLATSAPDRSREVMQTVAEAARAGIDAFVPEEDDAVLATLVERVRVTGLDVAADLADEASLGHAQRAVAFRVVQEALTNVLRHAPGSSATVAVRRTSDGVAITVANSSPGGAGEGTGTGQGLSGIRERVAAVGGQVGWRRRADGGFEVQALLPLSSPQDASAQQVVAP